MDPSIAPAPAAVVWGSEGVAVNGPPPSSLGNAVDECSPVARVAVIVGATTVGVGAAGAVDAAVLNIGGALCVAEVVADIESSGAAGASRLLRNFFAVAEVPSMSSFRLRGSGTGALRATTGEELEASALRFADGAPSASGPSLRLRAPRNGASSGVCSVAAGAASTAGTDPQAVRSSSCETRRAGTTVAALGIPRAAYGTQLFSPPRAKVFMVVYIAADSFMWPRAPAYARAFVLNARTPVASCANV